MLSQEEFLASMLESSAVVFKEHRLAHGAQVLRERIIQDLYDEAQLRNAAAHEAAVIQHERQQLRLGRRMSCILERHEPNEQFEPRTLTQVDDDRGKDDKSRPDPPRFSDEEIAECITLARAESRRETCNEVAQEDESCYVTAMAAIPQEHSDKNGEDRVDSILDTDESGSEKPSCMSTITSKRDIELRQRISAMEARMVSILETVLYVDREGLKEVITGAEPLITELERLVAAVKIHSQHLTDWRVARRRMLGVEDETDETHGFLEHMKGK